MAGCSTMQPRFGEAAEEEKQDKLLANAINKSTGKFYQQDGRCSEEGYTWTKFDEPCWGFNCQPGERKLYEECAPDFNYQKLPAPPAGGFRSCKDWKKAGYPQEDCNKTTCPSCFAPKAKPKPKAKKVKPKAKPKPPPPPCPCAKYGKHLDRKTKDGPCPKIPNKCGGRPPANQKCRVPGYGMQTPICKCGGWRCPTTKDVLMKMRRAGPKPKPKPKKAAKPQPKPAAGFGEAKTLVPVWAIAAMVGLYLITR